MKYQQQIKVFNLFFMLLLCTSVIETLGQNFDSKRLYVIKNIASNLVVDSFRPSLITAERDRGYSSQLWKLVPANNIAGYFYIISHNTGTVLDVDHCHTAQCSLRLNQYTGYKSQEWSISSKGIISNNYWNQNLEVSGRNIPGNPVIIHQGDDPSRQIFALIPRGWSNEDRPLNEKEEDKTEIN